MLVYDDNDGSQIYNIAVATPTVLCSRLLRRRSRRRRRQVRRTAVHFPEDVPHKHRRCHSAPAGFGLEHAQQKPEAARNAIKALREKQKTLAVPEAKC